MAIDAGILDQVTQEFLTVLKNDAHLIQSSAKSLFYYLVIIQLSLTTLWMVLAGESLQQFVTKLTQLVFSFGFFYALIDFGGQWVPALLNGFIQLGQQGGVSSLDPSSIIDQGLSISGAIFKGFFSWGLLGHPFVSMMGAIVCIAILIIYGLMAAELAIVLVKSYIIVATSGLFFAFGGSDYTREMTKKYFQASVGLGLQLMGLYLLLGVGQHVGAQWAQMTTTASQNHELMPMLVILAAVIVYYLILKNIPPFLAHLSGIGGFRNYGDAAVATAINAGMTGANLLSKTGYGIGSGIQAGTQAGVGLSHIWKGGVKGCGEAPNAFYGAYKAASAAAGGLAAAAANTVKDMATRQNQDKTTGEKFNNHLANKIYGVKNNSTRDNNNGGKKS